MDEQNDKETYDLIGICMEVLRILGPGLLEVIYKDALELELKNHGIHFEREKEFNVEYKGAILAHKFYTDFIVNDKIILEIKAVKEFNNEHIAQVLNYIKLSNGNKRLLLNFQTKSLQVKRYVI